MAQHSEKFLGRRPWYIIRELYKLGRRRIRFEIDVVLVGKDRVPIWGLQSRTWVSSLQGMIPLVIAARAKTSTEGYGRRIGREVIVELRVGLTVLMCFMVTKGQNGHGQCRNISCAHWVRRPNAILRDWECQNARALSISIVTGIAFLKFMSHCVVD